jgi:hypothetical protein
VYVAVRGARRGVLGVLIDQVEARWRVDAIVATRRIGSGVLAGLRST